MFKEEDQVLDYQHAPAQGDIMQARWGTHGDHSIIALYPSSVREIYDTNY